MPSNGTHVCVPCRRVVKGWHEACATCGCELRHMGTKWRAPKKSNDKAWAFLASGADYGLWDRKVREPLLQRGPRRLRFSKGGRRHEGHIRIPVGREQSPPWLSI